MKRKGGGKAKGNSFERFACKALSQWLTGGKRDDILWRSAMSGGRATVRAKKGSRSLAHVAGDICSVHDEGNKLLDVFLLECKFYKDLNTARLVFEGAGGKLWTFWQETVMAARAYNKLPILIAKQNLFPPVVVLESDTLAAFGLVEISCFPVDDMHIVSFEYFVNHAPVATLERWRSRRKFPQRPAQGAA